MRRIDSRSAKRMMKSMGMKIDGISNVQQVTIKTEQKEIIIEYPDVTVMQLKGEKVFQVSGGDVSERVIRKEAFIREEDVQLVASQTGKSYEEAEIALKETKGDLASAIILLQSRN